MTFTDTRAQQCVLDSPRPGASRWPPGWKRRPTGARLISRNRIATPGASRLARALSTYVMEPGSLIMERKMLLGIKQRAERLARDSRARCEAPG